MDQIIHHHIHRLILALAICHHLQVLAMCHRLQILVMYHIQVRTAVLVIHLAIAQQVQDPDISLLEPINLVLVHPAHQYHQSANHVLVVVTKVVQLVLQEILQQTIALLNVVQINIQTQLEHVNVQMDPLQQAQDQRVARVVQAIVQVACTQIQKQMNLIKLSVFVHQAYLTGITILLNV